MLIVHCSLKLAPEPASGRIKVIRNISAPLRLLVDCSSYQTASTAEAQGALRSWERRRPACCLKQHMQPEAGRLPSHHLIFFHTIVFATVTQSSTDPDLNNLADMKANCWGLSMSLNVLMREFA